MPLETVVADALGLIFTAEYCRPVTYAGQADVLAVVHTETRDAYIDRAANKRQCIIDVRCADVDQPAYRDAAVVDGHTWHVVAFALQACGLQWRIWLERDTRQLLRGS